MRRPNTRKGIERYYLAMYDYEEVIEPNTRKGIERKGQTSLLRRWPGVANTRKGIESHEEEDGLC